jgi:hypothetical protein
MVSENKIRMGFSRIKIDMDMLKSTILDLKENISQIKENQNYLFSEMTKKDRENIYEIKKMRDKIEFLEKQILFERS